MKSEFSVLWILTYNTLAESYQNNIITLLNQLLYVTLLTIHLQSFHVSEVFYFFYNQKLASTISFTTLLVSDDKCHRFVCKTNVMFGD